MSLRFSKDLLYQIASDSQNRAFNEIRTEFLADNENFTHFDLDRNGDEITLTFQWRDGPDRVQFTWLGTKHDFYRSAMGVRLDETLEALCRADPNLEAGGGRVDGKIITFRVQFADGVAAPVVLSPEKPGPESAPARVAPASPLVPPQGVGAEVAGGAGGASVAPPVIVESAPRPSPPPQPVPAGTGGSPSHAWDIARREGTLQSFVRFLQDHPDAPQAAEARRRADELREAKAYQRARKADDGQVYQAFLAQFPDSAHRGEVEARLEAAETARRQAEVERRTRAAADTRRRATLDEARKLDTPEAYRIFLTTYPDGPETAEVRRRMAQIAADDHAYEKAGDTLAGLETYLATRPRGRHATQARSHIQQLRRERVESDFAAARRAGTIEAMEAFLEAWPDGPRAREARAALADLASSRPQPRGASHGIEIALDAPEVETTPTVDGELGEPVWRGAPVAVVPVRRDGRVYDVEVRAVHTETELFLAVRWPDDTGDTRYRPWKWSVDDETYRQTTDLDDALAVAWYPPGGDPVACMLSGRSVGADVWMWRAQWSALSGLALDGRMQVSRSRLPRSNPYPAKDGSGQLWLRQPPDAGTSGWSFFIPVEYQGDVVDSYRPSRATGSRSDVRARGAWSEGRWTVEFARALDTRHEDDVRMGSGGAWAFALAVYDRAEKQAHASSGIVQLRIGGR